MRKSIIDLFVKDTYQKIKKSCLVKGSFEYDLIIDSETEQIEDCSILEYNPKRAIIEESLYLEN